ncbi:hypothetical protein ACS0TY_033361 [Phlomoides rotata]
MDFVTYLIFLFVFHLFQLNSSESNCQKSFKCGKFPMEFPFSDVRDPSGCGLIKVDGCGSLERPRILAREGFGYPIVEKISTYEFKINDSEIRGSLESRKCFTFRNVSLLQSPSISFTFSPNLTLFTCYNGSSDGKQLDDHFEKYHKQECEISQVYYNTSLTDVPPVGLNRVPKECSVTQLPVKSLQDSSDLFKLLTGEFTVYWNVSEDCVECYNGGGQCLTDNQNQFYCKQDKRVSKKLILSISLSGAGILLFLSITYIIWQRKKKNSGSFLLSRSISANPSSKSDIEDGGSYCGIPVFSYTELEEATNNFDPSQELGDGGFGTVYYGKLRDGREVAIKRLYEHNYKRVEQFLNEIKILTGLRHPNLVSLYGCTSRRSLKLLLVYEYVSKGTVADHLHEERAKEAHLTWHIRMNIAIDTATALAYLHKSDIIHRDVKTNNILLDSNYCVKVADFGISRLFPNDVTHISTAPQGTPGYVDPEYHQCYQLTDKSDVYSFGVVLIELISSMPAVDVTRHRHEINLANLALTRIQRCAFDELIDPSIGYGSDPEVTRMTTTVAELAFRCLQLEKDLRPSMDEVVTFLKDIKRGEGCNFEEIKEAKGGTHTNIPGVLLKNKSSSSTVTDTWASSESNTLSSVGREFNF